MAEQDQEKSAPTGVPWTSATRLMVALMSAFAVASLTALAVPMLRGAGRPSEVVHRFSAVTALPSAGVPAPGPSRELMVFVCNRIPTDQDYCDRYSRDILQRARLTQPQRAEAEMVQRRVTAALPRGRPGIPECLPVTLAGPAEPNPPCALNVVPPSADQVRQALTAAGYPNAVVRVARSDDPAPVGSVLVAVEVGPACVLVHTHHIAEQATVGGRLPGGRCLSSGN